MDGVKLPSNLGGRNIEGDGSGMIDDHVVTPTAEAEDPRGKMFELLLEKNNRTEDGMHTIKSVAEVRKKKNRWEARVIWEAGGSGWEPYENLTDAACESQARCSFLPV